MEIRAETNKSFEGNILPVSPCKETRMRLSRICEGYTSVQDLRACVKEMVQEVRDFETTLQRNGLFSRKAEIVNNRLGCESSPEEKFGPRDVVVRISAILENLRQTWAAILIIAEHSSIQQAFNTPILPISGYTFEDAISDAMKEVINLLSTLQQDNIGEESEDAGCDRGNSKRKRLFQQEGSNEAENEERAQQAKKRRGDVHEMPTTSLNQDLQDSQNPQVSEKREEEEDEITSFSQADLNSSSFGAEEMDPILEINSRRRGFNSGRVVNGMLGDDPIEDEENEEGNPRVRRLSANRRMTGFPNVLQFASSGQTHVPNATRVPNAARVLGDRTNFPAVVIPKSPTRSQVARTLPVRQLSVPSQLPVPSFVAASTLLSRETTTSNKVIIISSDVATTSRPVASLMNDQIADRNVDLPRPTIPVVAAPAVSAVSISAPQVQDITSPKQIIEMKVADVRNLDLQRVANSALIGFVPFIAAGLLAVEEVGAWRAEIIRRGIRLDFYNPSATGKNKMLVIEPWQFLILDPRVVAQLKTPELEIVKKKLISSTAVDQTMGDRRLDLVIKAEANGRSPFWYATFFDPMNKDSINTNPPSMLRGWIYAKFASAFISIFGSAFSGTNRFLNSELNTWCSETMEIVRSHYKDSYALPEPRPDGEINRGRGSQIQVGKPINAFFGAK